MLQTNFSVHVHVRVECGQEAMEFDRAVVYSLEHLGCSSLQLKDEQKASIEAVYNERDVFVWLPTGYGKSICYTTLPFVFDWKLGHITSSSSSMVLVISPLLLLMADQVLNLRRVGVRSAIVSSGAGVQKDLVATEENLEKSSVLYCAPEALVGSRWREVIKKSIVSERIVTVVVDEVHCLSKFTALYCGVCSL